MKVKRIALFGNFGQLNLGNECTLQAMIENIRLHLRGADMFIICTEPQDAGARHGLPAIPMSTQYVAQDSKDYEPKRRDVISRLLSLLFIRIPVELGGWFSAFRVLKDTEMLIMPGTSFLSDPGTGGFPYEVFKWSLVAKLRRCKVCIVSVGAGLIRRRLTRWFIKCALSLADYRSYRDDISKSRLESIGFNCIDDHVFPDLAFSVANSILPEPGNAEDEQRTIGVGIMDYYGPRGRYKRSGQLEYDRYMDKMTDFIMYLLGNRYRVRILHGDLRYDEFPRRDLKVRLQKRGIKICESDIIDEDMHSVADLLKQLASTDIVVSPRYHNLVLAIMLGKPVVSISYDEKNDYLLKAFDLQNYCQPIDQLDVEKLIRQLEDLQGDYKQFQSFVAHKTVEQRMKLKQQYEKMFAAFKSNGESLPCLPKNELV
jgi:polysaccharide pyruvyl transferase WcaK-like protein